MKLAELQLALRAADKAAVLVAPRVMERVIGRVAKLNNLFGDIPHRQCLVVERPVLYRHVDPDDLDLEPDRLLPPTVILLARPSPNLLVSDERDTLLLTYWRRLFHASVHRELERQLTGGKLTAAGISERIAAVGASEFAEIRMVLDQEKYLLPGADDTAVYVEFAAVYLELRFFAANLVPIYFPGLAGAAERIDRLLARDLEPEVLFEQTRLAGAPAPVVRTDTKSDESHDYYWRLIRSAERAERAGNTVRAAILRTKAARVAPAALTKSTRDDARADLQRLTDRLGSALQLGEAQREDWLRVLPALLDKADQGSNPSEAALLFDLQKVGSDYERDIYSLDVIEWLRTGGRRPIKRPLPSQKFVRITKHLRSAAQRLTMARLSDEERQHLDRLLQAALQRSEDRLRERFRPVLQDALASVGLHPANPPERAALAKMVEEMLDRITEVGFLTFSDLRDAVARNQLKLPDLADPQEFIRGDPLIRLDRRLGTALDGVYRPSEFYLRFLERFTSPLFGTATGRWLTLFVLLPFGGSMVILDAAQLAFEHFAIPSPIFGPLHALMRPRPAEEPAQPFLSAASLVQFLGVGFFLLALLHSEIVRHRCVQGLRLLWRCLRAAAIDLPAWLVTRPVLRQVWESWAFQISLSFLVKPLFVTALLWLLFEDLRPPVVAFITFLCASSVLNSRLGRAVTEAAVQAFVDLYELLRAGLLPGMLRLVLTLFKWIIDSTEYVLFTIDEWLRFRSGDSRASLVVRTLGTLLWFPVAFLVRFYLVVLIEPGFNPLKAPVSYLAAKFIYPVIGPLTERMVDACSPGIGSLPAWVLIGGTIWLLPDAFGFLAWELKENWRMYRANRRPTLRPVAVGPSGETVHQLLQLGFHSGTIPKLYARLRQAEREALQTNNWRGARTCWHSLQEVEKSLRRMVERELLTLLQETPPWQGQGLSVGRVALAPNRIRIEILHAGHPAEPAWLDWEEYGDRLVASIPQPGWLSQAPEAQREAMAAGLAGLYKLAGVDLVREQVRANVPAGAADFEVSGRDLVLWPQPRQAPAVLYDLDTPQGLLPPRTPEGMPAGGWPPLDPARVLYSRAPLTWQRWVSHWVGGADGKGTPPLFTPALQLLPA